MTSVFLMAVGLAAIATPMLGLPPSPALWLGAVIASARGDCQVIVLTCTPGRYADVGRAKVVTLP